MLNMGTAEPHQWGCGAYAWTPTHPCQFSHRQRDSLSPGPCYLNTVCASDLCRTPGERISTRESPAERAPVPVEDLGGFATRFRVGTGNGEGVGRAPRSLGTALQG